MAKRKNSRRRPQQKISLAVVAGLAKGMKPAIDRAIAGDLGGAIDEFGSGLTGFGPEGFNLFRIVNTVGPMVSGSIVSKGVTKLGVNRMIKLPFVKI